MADIYHTMIVAEPPAAPPVDPLPPAKPDKKRPPAKKPVKKEGVDG